MRTLRLNASFLLLSLVPSVAAAQMQTAEQPVIYGEDDREDVVGHPNADLRAIATDSAVALVARAAVQVSGQQVSFATSTLGESQNLCGDERFTQQPAAAFCSGSLIAPNLVMTAGHCVSPEPGACAGMFFVFGYQAASPESGSLASISTDDLYSCRQVLAHAEGTEGNASLDYAIVELDRPVAGRQPATVRAGQGPVNNGDPLVLIGSPSGIPTKIDAGGVVLDARAGIMDYFVGSTDSFGGNSGSGVWDLNSLDVVGILVSGETDYENDGSCVRVNYCETGECAGENITYAWRAVDELCRNAAVPELCGAGSQCGDGYCASDEDTGTCAEDCAAAVCGDNVCGSGEFSSCPDDCVVTVPAGWTCEAGWYGSFDGCDCDCGVEDPDCSIDPTCVTGGLSDLLCTATPTRHDGTPGGLGWVLGSIALVAIGGRRKKSA